MSLNRPLRYVRPIDLIHNFVYFSFGRSCVRLPISFENTCASDINLTTDVQDNRINLFVQILNTEQQEDSSCVGGDLAEDKVQVKEQIAEWATLIQYSGMYIPRHVITRHKWYTRDRK